MTHSLLSKNPVKILGCSMTKVTRSPEKSIKDMAYDVFSAAIRDAGISKDDIEGLFVTPPNFPGPPSFMFACELADYFQLKLKSLSLTECGGATSTAAMHYAIDEILLGRNRINMVIAIDVRLDPLRDMDFMLPNGIYIQSSIYGVYRSPYGVGTPLPLYAMSAQRYMHEYDISEEDLAQVAVVLRENAAKNPNAQFREPLTVEDVLKSHMISPPFKLLDCSSFSTAAGACIFADGKISSKKKEVFITGMGEFHHNSNFIPLEEDLTSFTSIKEASKEAFSMSGLKPSDIDVAEVYGVFTATELMIYEDLGFFEKGKSIRAVREGKTRLTGDTPMNPSGGRLSLGHPAAATPMLELVEVTRQIRGECGERQVKDPRHGLVHAEHGMLNGSTVLILEKG